ncbi:MAG: rod shape-determining protein [Ruminococcaceae bacterium]|nr:rod shape-determining protein [Oscillospiraceae bacterium]
MGYFKQNIAIDLGTATVLVCVDGKGVVIKAPSIVAVKEGTNEVLAIGDEARLMMGRTPFDITTVRPVQNGVISSYTVTKAMIAYYVDKAITNPIKKKFKPDLLIAIPSKTTNVEKRAVFQAAGSVARRVFLVEEPLAAAIGAGIDISRPTGNMIVDIGGGTTDIAVISYDGIVTSKSVKVGGDTFDETVKNYLKKKHNLMVGDTTAEQIKIEVGCLYHGIVSNSIEIRGSDILTGLPRERVITSDELLEVMIDTAVPILDGIHAVLEETPPELAADIYCKGIVMTGGGAQLSGFDELIRKSTGVDVMIATDPQYCVVRGSMQILSEMSSAKKRRFAISD